VTTLSIQLMWPYWVLAFGSALLITAVPMPLVMRFARQVGAVAVPSSERMHQEPTPLLGGVAIVMGCVLGFCAFNGLTWLPEGSLPTLFALGIILVIGAADDIVEFRARTKLCLQVAVAACYISWGAPVSLTGYAIVDRALTGFWLVATMNAFNLIDGFDGLAAGVGMLETLAIAGIALWYGHFSLVTWALALGGALSGFMLFNLKPASIFMGDAGAQGIGLLLGVLSIRISNFDEIPFIIRIALPLLIMVVPLLDATTVTVTRVATGHAVGHRGLDHTHHRLARLGLSDLGVVGVLYVVQALGSASAMALTIAPANTAVLILPFVGLPFALFALFVMDRSFDSTEPGELKGLPVIGRWILSLGYKRRIIEIALDLVLIAAAYCGAFLLNPGSDLRHQEAGILVRGLGATVAVSLAAFLIAGMYRGMWRYAGLADGLRFAKAVLFAVMLTLGSSYIFPINLSAPGAAIFALLLFNLVVASRFSFQIFKQMIGRFLAKTLRVVVVGASSQAEAAAHHLMSNGHGYTLLGFIDNDEFKRGKLLQGHRVFGSTYELPDIYARLKFDEIIVASDRLSQADIGVISRFAQERGVKIERFAIGFNEFRPWMAGSASRS